MAKKLNILVIDDCAKDQELVGLKLKRFNLTFASTLKAGLTALENGQFDVVLLDLGLINGKRDTVLQDVKEKRGAAATVVLTGDIRPATRDIMLGLGADGFMVKGRDDATAEDMEWVIFRALEHREGIT